MNWLGELLAKMFGWVASLFTAFKWGKSKANTEQAEKLAKEKVEDAKITSGPYVDKPFSGMRPKD